MQPARVSLANYLLCSPLRLPTWEAEEGHGSRLQLSSYFSLSLSLASVCMSMHCIGRREGRDEGGGVYRKSSGEQATCENPSRCSSKRWAVVCSAPVLSVTRWTWRCMHMGLTYSSGRG